MSAAQTVRAHLAELRAATGITGEVVERGEQLFVVLHAVPLPEGVFAVEKTDVLFITDKQYPLSAMDMFWTEVEVARVDGTIPEGATEIEQYLDRRWRRFSWHRNGVWNVGGNPLLDHFVFMEGRFSIEPRREAA
jgi:hypothetical protein